jgi:hypothetical protein
LVCLLGAVALAVPLVQRFAGNNQEKPLAGPPNAFSLRQAPGVVRVEELVSLRHPTHRIIHVRDWHFVARDRFTIDVQDAAGRKLTPP